MENTVSVAIGSIGGVLLGLLLTLLWQDYHHKKQQEVLPRRLDTEQFRGKWQTFQERFGIDMTWQEAYAVLSLEKLMSAERQQDVAFSIQVLESEDLSQAPERVQFRLVRLKHLIETGGLVGDTES